MTQINNQSFDINYLQNAEQSGNTKAVSSDAEKRLQEFFEEMQDNTEPVDVRPARKISGANVKDRADFEKIIEDFKKYLEADGDFSDFDKLKINTVQYLIDSGASASDVKKAIAGIKKSVEAERKHNKEVETFKTTQKASNGLTYKQAEEICEYYQTMYKSYGPNAVDVLWEGDGKGGGHYRSVTTEEKWKR